MFIRVVRLETAQQVADVVARRFMKKTTELLDSREEVHVCLTGGGTADLVYERFADLSAEAKLDTTRSEERRVGKECRSRWSPYH